MNETLCSLRFGDRVQSVELGVPGRKIDQPAVCTESSEVRVQEPGTGPKGQYGMPVSFYEMQPPHNRRLLQQVKCAALYTVGVGVGGV